MSFNKSIKTPVKISFIVKNTVFIKRKFGDKSPCPQIIKVSNT